MDQLVTLLWLQHQKATKCAYMTKLDSCNSMVSCLTKPRDLIVQAHPNNCCPKLAVNNIGEKHQHRDRCQFKVYLLYYHIVLMIKVIHLRKLIEF